MSKAKPLGAVIAERRKEKKLTQQQLADLIGKSKGFVGRLERSEGADPSYATLINLAEKLGFEHVPEMLERVTDDEGENEFKRKSYVLTKREEGEDVARQIEGVDYKSMNTGFPYSRIQVMTAQIEKGREIPAHYHWGDEFLYVIDGSLKFEQLPLPSQNASENQDSPSEDPPWSSVALGEKEDHDCVWLRAWVPHRYTNVAESNTQALVVSFDPRGARGVYKSDEDPKPSTVERWDSPPKDVIASYHGLGPKITEARQQIGFSKQDMVNDGFLKGKLSASHLSRIERNEATPSYDVLRGLHDLFDRPISFFFNLTENAYSSSRLAVSDDKVIPSGDTDVVASLPAYWKKVGENEWRKAATQDLIQDIKFAEGEFPRVRPYMLRFGADHGVEEEGPKSLRFLFPAEGQDVIYTTQGSVKVKILKDYSKNIRNKLEKSSSLVVEDDLLNLENVDDNDFEQVEINPGDVFQVDTGRVFYSLRTQAVGTEAALFRWRPSWEYL